MIVSILNQVLERTHDAITIIMKPKEDYYMSDSGSLLDTISQFCYNKTLIKIKTDHF